MKSIFTAGFLAEMSFMTLVFHFGGGEMCFFFFMLLWGREWFSHMRMCWIDEEM